MQKPNGAETRIPNIDELMWLADYLTGKGFEFEHATADIEGARMTVIPRYMPDSPGWCGDVLVVIWGGSVGLYQLFMVDRAKKAVVPIPSEFEGGKSA